MINSSILIIHIVAGVSGILTGMVALFSKKGGNIHRRLGNAFFISMVIMSTSAAYLALFQTTKTNLLVGLLTLYLVVTAQRAVVNKRGKPRQFEYITLLYIIGVCIAGIIFSLNVRNLAIESGRSLSVLEYFLFFYTGMAMLCAILDMIMIWRGGVFGTQRIARHLWRMCFALWIASGSLFLGQQQVFPRALQGSFILVLPVITVVVLWLFWLVRVFFVRRFRV